MSDIDLPMVCKRHGESYATFVCKHLVHGNQLGFVMAYDPEDPRPDAWCNGCDEILLEENGWNDRSEAFAGITAVCAFCYDEIRRRNWIWSEEQPWEWLLENALDQNLAHPDTFHLPPLELRRNLAQGDFAKLVFLLPGRDENGEFYQGERMWVTVTKVDPIGYWGVLESEPITFGSLKTGDQMLFGPEHIIDLRALHH